MVDATVAQHAVGTDVHPIAELHLALEHHVGVNEYVAAGAQVAAHIKTCGIDHGHSGEHQFASAPGTVMGLDFGELQLVVDAEDFGHRRRNQRGDRHLVAHRHRNDIGEVVLALRIAVLEFAEPAAQPLHRHRHDTGVALSDLAFARGGILLLDNAADFAARIAHDATVARRILEHDREQAHGLGSGQGDE